MRFTNYVKGILDLNYLLMGFVIVWGNRWTWLENRKCIIGKCPAEGKPTCQVIGLALLKNGRSKSQVCEMPSFSSPRCCTISCPGRSWRAEGVKEKVVNAIINRSKLQFLVANAILPLYLSISGRIWGWWLLDLTQHWSVVECKWVQLL